MLEVTRRQRSLLADSPTRILAVTTVDVMAWVLLKPWFSALRQAGYEVHIACSRGKYFDLLAAEGFHMHSVPLTRSFNPLAHVAPLFALYRLVRRGRFGVVNTHSPVAAAVGRLAAWLARCPKVVYTVHGFYFHDNMHPLWRGLFVGVEWIIGWVTDQFMFVSEEDRQTALRTGIARGEGQTSTICNGIDLSVFSAKSAAVQMTFDFKREMGIPASSRVVGIVGRIVKEKGYREFFQMAKEVVRSRRDVVFVVVGDSLPSDRDHYASELKRQVNEAGLQKHFLFTGFTSEVPKYLQVMDLFVLPSYREGFPRSVLEAMATGLPVIATDIRGCREAVVDGKTGVIVPPKDAKALADAVSFLLDHPDLAKQMGGAGRRRAVELYDQRLVQQRFVAVFDRLVRKSAEQAPAESLAVS